MSGSGFVCVHPAGLADSLESVGLCISPSSGSSQLWFLQIHGVCLFVCFYQIPFLPLLWWYKFRPFGMAPQVSEVTHRFILLIFFFSLLLKLYNFYWYILMFTNSFLRRLHSAMKPLQWALFVWNFPLTLPSLRWVFLSAHFKNIHPHLLEELYNSCF